ncbi:S8 family peptidase [Salimicrobium humidisoli]|uniref:Alkaline serine protease n=1 Tax=Salimicrobium humidisoli TaxID=2029857 RepID=A0ABX4HUD9_9BACI|nr:S8 family serine peptidase [Salimicrobium humidisoli]PBB06444.1 alkaline serine protease [Salimicrobium humidisoli]
MEWMKDMGSKLLLAGLLALVAASGGAVTENVSAESSYRVVVGFEEGTSGRYRTAGEGEHLHTYDSLNAVSMKMNREQIIEMQKKPEVAWVEFDQKVSVAAERETWGYKATEPSKARSWGLTGEGVNIAVIDTGVAKDHPDLNVRGGVNTIEGSTGWADDNGHGTHVAGVLNAQPNNRGTVGIAPDADLYAVKALNKDGDGWESEIIAGIEWAFKKDVDIINLSLTTCSSSIPMKKTLEKAEEKGVVVVAASGNKTPCNGRYLPDVMYPARYDSVVGTGAVNDEFQRAAFSYGGNSLDVVAPGTGVYSTYVDAKTGVNGYEYLNGTSMAAPFVSGVFALNREAYPHYTIQQLRKEVRDRSKDLGPKGKDKDFGHGLVQAPVNPFKDVSSGRWYYEPVRKLYVDGTVTGFRNATFRPDGKISRQDVVTMLGRTLNLEEKDSNTGFPDVQENSYSAGYISAAVEKGFINGFPDGTFAPRKNITRGDMAVMLDRAFQFPEAGRSYFSDVNGRYYTEPINAAAKAGVLSGYRDGTYQPSEPVSRAELAKALYESKEYSSR